MKYLYIVYNHIHFLYIFYCLIYIFLILDSHKYLICQYLGPICSMMYVNIGLFHNISFSGSFESFQRYFRKFKETVFLLTSTATDPLTVHALCTYTGDWRHANLTSTYPVQKTRSLPMQEFGGRMYKQRGRVDEIAD